MAKKSKYKTMMIREEVWRKLTKQKKAGESYSDLLDRLSNLGEEVEKAGGFTAKFTSDLMASIRRTLSE